MIKRNIPNAITCGNLVCGVVGIIFLFSGHEHWAAYCIFLAGILDFLDGFVARLLKVSSPIGKDLDSLADGLTFGVLPALILYKMLQLSCYAFSPDNVALNTYLPFVAILIALFSIIRLAVFNNDTRQTDVFIGVPTPANGLCVAALLLFVDQSYFDLYTKWHSAQDVVPDVILNNPFISALKDSFLGNSHHLDLPIYYHPYVIVGYCIIMSYLLVCSLPLFALKFKAFGFKGNELRYSFLLICLILFLFLQFKAIPIVVFLYILISLVIHIFTKQKTDEIHS
jgi:CDP-diacylglycerol---serine O-phosphatidyltransferase